MQRRNNGRWIMAAKGALRDGGTVAVYSDITKLKQREQDLTENSGSQRAKPTASLRSLT